MRKTLATCLLGFACASAAESPVVLDANGNLLGDYGGASTPGSILVILQSGFTLSIASVSGEVGLLNDVASADGLRPNSDVYFATNNCQGAAYFPPVAGLGKYVFRHGPTNQLWVIPPRADQPATVLVQAQSRLEGANCAQFGPVPVQLMPIEQNNPANTGWDRGPQVPGPLKLGRQDVPRAMLRDGFENPQAALVKSGAAGIA